MLKVSGSPFVSDLLIFVPQRRVGSSIRQWRIDSEDRGGQASSLTFQVDVKGDPPLRQVRRHRGAIERVPRDGLPTRRFQKQRFQPHLQKSWPADRSAIAFISQKGVSSVAYEASKAGRSRSRRN